MKLINKTLFYYLLISFPLLILSGFLSYYLIREEVRDGSSEELLKEKFYAEKFISQNPGGNVYYLSPDSISTAIKVPFHKESSSFSDTIIFDRIENEHFNHRLLKSYSDIGHQSYLISLVKPSLEDEELMEGLFSTFAIIGGFLLVAFFAVNWLVSKNIWAPFYKTIEKLNNYNFEHHTGRNFESSSIKEFNQLNKSLNQMTEKIFTDFRLQKEFTENASHEMQTPLAVIKTNLSLLMQSPNLQADEMSQLQSIENTVKKLTALNKTLLLLAKIENKQFKENLNIDLTSILQKVLVHFEDLLTAKRITVENNAAEGLMIYINPTLAEILVTNLVQNAIRHNITGGKIGLKSAKNSFTITNTGEPLSFDHKDLFTRFKKNDASRDSMGLGLSIVKSIVDLYGYKINYGYLQSHHAFILKF